MYSVIFISWNSCKVRRCTLFGSHGALRRLPSMIFKTYFLPNDPYTRGFLSPPLLLYIANYRGRTPLCISFTCSVITLHLSQVLSIDGIPVTHMTRLDCVRRLKESQLVIRLMVRCRGALRPEVVSAERKIERNKVPPELPAAPPPVPPRKLRHRGSADGEANPSPIKKLWDNSKSQNGSQNGTSVSQVGLQCVTKIGSYENCESSSRNVNGLNQESPKESPKSKQVVITVRKKK